MRIRWRGLALPRELRNDPHLTSATFGRFTVEPFQRGVAETVANGLRRVLLSSVEGAAVTAIKIKGVQHNFTSIPGVKEDVTDIELNVKDLVVKLEGDEPKTLRLAAMGPGKVTADLIEADTAVTILNKGVVIATLTDKVEFVMDLRVGKGRGYVPASEQVQDKDEQDTGLIPVDAIYSPVRRVRYQLNDTGVGERTKYERLTIDIWTNGAMTPEMALVEAAKILRKQLDPFVQYFELSAHRGGEPTAAPLSLDEELIRKLNMPISELDLSERASNCLETARIATIADLVARTESDLLKIRLLSRRVLREINRRLRELGLRLGMGVEYVTDEGSGGGEENSTVATATKVVAPPRATTSIDQQVALYHIYSASDEIADYQELEAAVEDLVQACGGSIQRRQRLQRGSWWRRAVGSLFGEADAKEANDAALKIVKYAAALALSGKHAADVQFVGKPRAEITTEQANAVVSIIVALANRPQGAVIRLESIIFVKQPDQCGGHIFVRHLTNECARQLEANADTLSDPRLAAEFLQSLAAPGEPTLPPDGRPGPAVSTDLTAKRVKTPGDDNEE